MPYPTNVGAPAFTVPDVLYSRKERGANARHQLESKFEDLKKEYFKLVRLAEDTEKIYSAKCNFVPVVGKTYHLYSNQSGEFLSMVEPSKWDFDYHGSYRLTSEHVWERME